MIAGLSIAAFTRAHVVISLFAIASGMLVFAAMLRGRWLPSWNRAFIVTTLATSASGFLLPSAHFGPPHVIGLMSIMVLAVAIFALQVRGLAGAWGGTYLLSSLSALYLSSFVGVVQAFRKIPGLHALAPTQSEAPFAVTQALLLVLFVATGVLAWGRWKVLDGRAPAVAA